MSALEYVLIAQLCLAAGTAIVAVLIFFLLESKRRMAVGMLVGALGVMAVVWPFVAWGSREITSKHLIFQSLGLILFVTGITVLLRRRALEKKG